jgi:monoamine oxidase
MLAYLANRQDVIVIGAGLSGLMAALILKKKGKQIVVLEAQPRVGGRIFTSTEQGSIIDLGAQFVSPQQERIQKLLTKYGLSTTQTYNKGKKLYALEKQKKWSKNDYPLFTFSTLLDYYRMLRGIGQLLDDIDLKRPWLSKKANSLDNMSLEGWLQGLTISHNSRAFFQTMAEGSFCTNLSEISFLDVLWDLKSTGGLNHIFTSENEWITDGAGKLPLRMATELGACVKLNQTVTKIEWSESSARVFTQNGEWIGKKVIMAMPPPFSNQIQFKPPLPANRVELAKMVGLGCTIKCVIIYPTAFWRERGENGKSFFDKGPVKETIDISPSDDSKGVLAAFINGKEAKKLSELEPHQRKKEVLDCLSYLLGIEALQPTAYYEKDWFKDPWSKGGYGATFPPGILTQYGSALTQPVGPIHWAGTETANEWRLYMEGALEAGERAALEVLQLLS